MGRFGDRLGKFDDDAVIYRADDPAQRVHWRRVAVSYLFGGALGGLLLAGADLVLWAAVRTAGGHRADARLSDSLHPLAAREK